MSVNQNSMLLRWTYLRDVVFRQQHCRLTLATFLRHPVDAALSAYAYLRPRKTPLVEWARERAASLLGVKTAIFADAIGRLGKASDHGAAFDAHVLALATRFPAATLDPLLGALDVVGHTERFTESLLLLIDHAGLRKPLACSAPRNLRATRRSGGGADKRSSAPAANSSEWRAVAAVMPALVEWYDRRLAAFDAATAERGAAFRQRVETLRTLRAKAAAAEKSQQEQHLSS